MLLSFHLKRWLLELAAIFISSFTYFKHSFEAQNNLLVQSSLPLLQLQGEQWRFQNTNDSMSDCSSHWMTAYQNYPLDRESRDKMVGSGWNKQVYKIGQAIVLKKLNAKGISLDRCYGKGRPFASGFKCIEDVANGFIKEIGFLISLQGDPNVPQLFAYCIPQDYSYNFYQLSSVVSGEYTPLDMVYLLQTTWSNRIQITLHILDFVQRIWPVQLHDFRRQQFVLSSLQKPIYVDFDDASEVKKCGYSSKHNCYHSFDQDFQYNHKIACQTYEDFSKDLFWLGAPKQAMVWLKELKLLYLNKTLDVTKFQGILKQLSEL